MGLPASRLWGIGSHAVRYARTPRWTGDRGVRSAPQSTSCGGEGEIWTKPHSESGRECGGSFNTWTNSQEVASSLPARTIRDGAGCLTEVLELRGWTSSGAIRDLGRKTERTHASVRCPVDEATSTNYGRGACSSRGRVTARTHQGDPSARGVAGQGRN